MKITYNHFLPFPGFTAMMLFGRIFARKKYKPLPEVTVNHEAIHDAQAADCGGYWRYYPAYLRQWFRYGYKRMPFELEAYRNAANLSYLEQREPKAWTKYE